MTFKFKASSYTNILFYIILILFTGLTNNSAFSQEEEEIEEAFEYTLDTINLTELVTLLNFDESEIIISDKVIIPDENDDEFLIDKIFFSEYQVPMKSDAPKKIYFYNSVFDFNTSSPLIIRDINLLKFNIIGCEFMSPINIENSTQSGNYPIIIENCSFKDDLVLLNPQNKPLKKVLLKNNDFSSVLIIQSEVEELKISGCNFISDKELYSSKDSEYDYYQLNLSGIKIDDFSLTQCLFDNSGLENIGSVSINGAEMGSIYFFQNKMNILDLSFAEVSKALLVDSLLVSEYIGILNFDFPESNTNIPWYNLGGEKLAVFHENETEEIIAYQAKTHDQLSDNLKYNDLISAYTKFNTLYHDRGDITSANSSYVEIKDIETRRQAYIQDVNPSLNNYINYNLNLFLRFFSDYATNPGKSLKLSLWVILIFTVLYMFSFYRWDGMNYSYYVNQFNKFHQYISSKDPIDEVFELKKNEVEEDIEELRNKYLASDKKVPKLLWLFGNPLHFLGKFRYKMIPNLIKFFNFHPNEWESHDKSWDKFRAGTLIFTISILYIVYIIIVKFLNSFILSINSFFVIGFGALPEEEEGIAMYLSIIEGILGWFLLTIFTITLLSQVLQSA